MINLTLSVCYKFICLHFQDFNGVMFIRIMLRIFYFDFRAESIYLQKYGMFFFIYFSLEAIFGLKSISGKSTIEQLLLYSN